MKSTTRNFLIVLLIAISVMPAIAQDFKQTLTEMQRVMKEAGSMHIKMDIRVYTSPAASQLLFHEKAEVTREGEDNYSYHFNKTDFLMNHDYIVVVDNNDKQINLSRRSERRGKDALKNVVFDMDSVLAQFDTYQLVKREGLIDHFKVVQKDSQIEQIDLFVNNTTFLLSKMQTTYRGGQFVSIGFDVFEVNTPSAPNEFSERRYVEISKASTRGAGRYVNYSLVDTNASN